MARGSAARKATNVSARVDLSEVFERALEAAVREARQRRWVEDNRQAFADYDDYVERHGVFSQGKRLF